MRNFKISISSVLLIILFSFLIGYGSLTRNKNADYFTNNSGFVVQNVNAETKSGSRVLEKMIPTDVKSVHASALVDTGNSLMVLFFGGSGEGKRDVKIYQSFFNKSQLSANNENATWSKPTVLLDSSSLAKMTGKYIKTLGNPIVFKDTNHRVHVFIVATNLGGWATSKIYQFRFTDDLKSLIYVQELKLSPFMNFSHLIRTPAIPLSDGGFMLPLYHEMATKFPLIAFFDANANLVFTKQVNDAKALIQPSIAAINKNSCLSAFRVYGHKYESTQLLQTCEDKGNKWDLPLIKSNLKNDDNSSIVLRFEQGFLFIHNDSTQNPILDKIFDCKVYFDSKEIDPYLNFAEVNKITSNLCRLNAKGDKAISKEERKYGSRQSLSLFYLSDAELANGFANFKRLATIDVTTRDGEVSYPAALLDDQFLHITYTHNRKNIKYMAVSTKKIHELINRVNNDNVLLSEGIK